MTSKAIKKQKGKKPAKKRALRPSVSPADTVGSAMGRHGMLLLPQRQAGVRVTEYTALSSGPVMACVRCISEDIAKLPWEAFRFGPDGVKKPIPDHDIQWILNEEANPETSAYHFRETLVGHALTWGNGYAEIERDGAGRPLRLWQITPDRVQICRDDRGGIVYVVRNPNEPDTFLEREDVFHLHGFGFDGLVGYSVIHLARRSVGLAISLEESAANFTQNDSTPGGYLIKAGKLSEQAKDNLRQSWNRMHRGPTSGRRVVAILEDGLEWKQTGLPPEDSQHIQQRQATPAEICRWFRVPPHKIADLQRATFSNIEEQNREYADDALHPMARRLESEANIKLFGRTNRGTIVTCLNMRSLTRGNVSARTAYYNAMLDRGVLSINDVREEEGLNPIGPDGDKRFVPLNMQLLDQAGEEPAAPPPAKPGEGTPKEEAGESAEEEGKEDKAGEKAMAMLPVLEEACGRLLSRESQRKTQAAIRFMNEPDKLAEFCDGLAKDQAVYLRKALAPGIHALLSMNGGARQSTVDIALSSFAEMYLADLRGRFQSGEVHRLDEHRDYAVKLLNCALAAEAASLKLESPACLIARSAAVATSKVVNVES